MNQVVFATVILFVFITSPLLAQWESVWSDEFDYTGLPDKTKWGYDVGGNGWGNLELQYYTGEDIDNARVGNGVLTITALKEKIGTNDYSSARLITKNKGDWCYGRFEIAAKLPRGVGLWPAIWMLPTDNAYGVWPRSGEIDIMENVGFEPNIVHFTIHTESYNHSIGTSKGASVTLADPYNAFVVYALEWYKDSLVFFADNKRTFLFRNEGAGSKAWPFDKRFYLLLNIAVGGTWGGQKGVDEGICPADMVIDYVRVYKYNPTAVNAPAKGSQHREPVVTWSNNRLIVGTELHVATVIRVFSISGRQVMELSVPSPESGCKLAASLPQGGYVAVAGVGTVRRAVRFAAVR